MDWLFENLGKLAPVVIFLIYMISSLKGRNQEEEEPDPQAAERARRIQEEIRRKIMERQKGGAPSNRESARPEVREVQEPEFEPSPFEPFFEPDPEPYVRRVEAPKPVLREEPQFSESFAVDDEIERRQREVEENLQKARRAREEARKKAAAIEHQAIYGRKERPRSVGTTELRKRLLDGLGDPNALRTSVLLKEVLEKPIGMR